MQTHPAQQLRNPKLPNSEAPHGLFYLHVWLSQLSEQQTLHTYARSANFQSHPYALRLAINSAIGHFGHEIRRAIKEVTKGGYLPFAHVDTTMVAP